MSPTTCRRVCCEFATDTSGSTTLPLHSSLGLQVYTQTATTEGEIDAAFATLTKQRIGALFVASDVLFLTRREKLAALAARYVLPTIYPFQVRLGRRPD